MTGAIERYLAKHAEPAARWARAPGGSQDDDVREAAVVVPMYDERIEALVQLCETLAPQGALLVVVVNEPPAAPSVAQASNRALVDFAASHAGRRVHEQLWRGQIADCAIALLDFTGHAGHPIAAEQGVGAARKAGLDYALALHAYGHVRRSWLYTTDADVTLPADYLAAAPPRGAALSLFPFWHEPGGCAEVDRLTALYELWLRHYAAGVRWAGSAYGLTALGSTLAVSAGAYAAVRGMPKRSAGEDFHLVSKLVSTGPVDHRGGEPVRIRARRSTRVPFGTGPGIARWERAGTRQFYDPRIFECLRHVMAQLGHVATGAPVPTADALGAEISPTWAALRVHERLSQALRGALTDAVREHRIRQWFDGLKVLRFVHGVERCNGWSRLDAEDAMQASPFVDVAAGAAVDDYRRWLAAAAVRPWGSDSYCMPALAPPEGA